MQLHAKFFKGEIMKNNPIAYYFPSWKNPYELKITAIEKDHNRAYIHYSEYTGYGYKPHKKRIYAIDKEYPYFIHNGYRIRLVDCHKVYVDENNFVQRLGECLTI